MRFGYGWLKNWRSRRAFQSLFEGYRGSALLHVAAHLGIADLLAQGSRSSHELAQSLGADAQALHRFLRGLVVCGICKEEKDGTIGLTKLGTWLQEEKPGSIRGRAILGGEAYKAWGSLLHTIMTGETAFTHIFGSDVWERRKQTPEADEYANKEFAEGAAQIAREILAAYDLSSVRTIADIGGGYGAFIAVVLRRFPALTGILFDQPHVIAEAPSYLEEAGVSERCRILGGDFFARVPEGADLYVLKSVLHDWDDEQSKDILNNCRRAMSEKGRLLLIERIMPDRAKQSPYLVFLDLQMLAVTGGRERTAAEFRAIFEAAGLELTRIIRLPSGFNMIEGVCAKTPDSAR